MQSRKTCTSLAVLTVLVESVFNVFCLHHEKVITEIMEKKSSHGDLAVLL
jgi:hypothetical protein